MPTLPSSASPPSAFRLWRSILRRWPKAASVTRPSLRTSAGSGVCARHQMHHRRRHLRRRREGLRRHVEGDPRLGAPAGEHAQPAVGVAAGRGDDALGDLALEHQRQRPVEGRPVRRPSASAPAVRCRYCRAGWRRSSPGSPAGERREVGLQRVAGNHLQPAGIVVGDLGQRGQAALVALDRDDPLGAAASAARGSGRRARARPRSPSRRRDRRRRGRSCR